MNFQIVSDSSCDLGRERAARLGVRLVSYYAALGSETYWREERDITAVEFYQKMADNPGVFPRTSRQNGSKRRKYGSPPWISR